MSDLPQFEMVRREAYKLLGDVHDLLRSDVADPPRGERGDALRCARNYIAKAKEELNDAAERGR